MVCPCSWFHVAKTNQQEVSNQRGMQGRREKGAKGNNTKRQKHTQWDQNYVFKNVMQDGSFQSLAKGG